MKRKSIIWTIILSLCLMGMNAVQAQSNTTISVKMPESAKAGEVITAKVMVDNIDESAVGLKLDVTYDANTLEYVSDKSGEKAIGTMNLSKHVPEEQRIRVGIVALLGLKESGCYYEIQFKVKEVASTTTKLDVKISELTDSKGNELAYSTNGASANIEGVAVAPNEQQEPEEEPKEEVTNGENKVAPEDTTKEEIVENNQKIQIPLQGTTQKNIKEYFKQNQAEGLTWNVQDVQIAELQEDGTILPKQAGNTDVVIKDAEGNIVAQMPLEVLEEEKKEQTKEGMNKPVMIIVVIAGVIIGTVVGFVATKKKMKK